MSDLDKIEPFEKQRLALECPAFEVLYGGQKGGGKSQWLLLALGRALRKAHARWSETGVKQAQCRIVLFRKNLKDLSDLIIKSKQVFPAFDPGAEFKENLKKWEFSSGATVECAHLDGPSDHENWNGQQITVLGIDQVEQVKFEAYAMLVAQVRSGDPHYKDVCQVLLTANPGKRVGLWVKERFIDPCPQGMAVLESQVKLRNGTTKTVTKAFIPSALEDNPFLNDGNYEAVMRDVLPDHQVKAYLEDVWDVLDDAYFASRVDPKVHFVDSFPIPNWEVIVGIDWGQTAPACAEFVAYDGDDTAYVFGEFYRPGGSGVVWGKELKDVIKASRWWEDGPPNIDSFYCVVDWQAKQGESPAYDGIASHGFRLFNAEKSRPLGIQQILIRLAAKNLVIFKDRCPKLCESLMSVEIDEHNRDDYQRKSDYAHPMDALRFALCEHQVMSFAPEDPMDAQVREWERYLRRTKKPRQTHDIQTGYDG